MKTIRWNPFMFTLPKAFPLPTLQKYGLQKMASAFYAITTPKFQKDSCGYLCKSLKHVAKPSLICGILHSDRLVFTANLKDRSIIILLDGLFSLFFALHGENSQMSTLLTPEFYSRQRGGGSSNLRDLSTYARTVKS